MKNACSKNYTDIARQLRQESTQSEEKAWQLLRSRQLGFKFRRQHPIAGFILDFYCHELGLAIELDGFVHRSGAAKAYDSERDSMLRERRIRNEEVCRSKLEEIIARHRKGLGARRSY